MSKINELIQTLCPDGVEYKLFGDVASICRGASPRPIKQFVTEDAEGVNWIKIGDTKVGSKYITETAEKITEAGAKKSRYVRIGDFIMSNSMSFGRPYICQIEGCIHDGWLAISEFHDSFNSDFLYYLLCSTMVQKMMEKKASNGGAVSNLNADIVRALELPVPPFPVQDEIVRILDEYTDLEVELEAKLSEEIELKQKQYEFYRACLFNVKNADILKIGDFTQVFSASRVHKSDWKSEGVRFWRSSDLMSYFNGVENPRGKVFISYELYEKLSAKSGKIRKYDILITGGGSIGVPYLVPDDEPLYVKDADLLCIQRNDRVDSEYLYFYFLTSEFRDYLKDITHDATIAHYTISQIKETPVPVPSMTEQRKIVKALKELKTEMDAMISTLNTELESRKKQYAYYRDQLLTFKRKE